MKHEQGCKICANDVLDRRELRNFHPDLQRYLDEHGLEDLYIHRCALGHPETRFGEYSPCPFDEKWTG